MMPQIHMTDTMGYSLIVTSEATAKALEESGTARRTPWPAPNPVSEEELQQWIRDVKTCENLGEYIEP